MYRTRLIINTNVRRKKSNSEVSLSITGIQRLQNPHYNKKAKYLWMLLLITISCICFYHVATMVREYMKNPTITRLTMEQHEHVQFPYITICSATAFNFLNQLLQFADTIIMESEEPMNITFRQIMQAILDDNDLTTQDLWDKVFVLNREDFQVYRLTETIEQMVDFHSSPVLTLWGICTILELNDTWKYEKDNTYVKIYSTAGDNVKSYLEPFLLKSFINLIKPLLNGTDEDYLTIIIAGMAMTQLGERFKNDFKSGNYYYAHHHSNNLNQLNLYYYSAKVNDWHYTTGLITMKKFKLLNMSDNPCYTEDDIVNCWNECTNRKLATYVNCSLPFMKLQVYKPECVILDHFIDVLRETLYYYRNFNSTECECSHRICDQTIYDIDYSIDRRIDFEETHLTYMFTDMLEQSEEVYSYKLRTLLSNIGGSVGVFLGISVLTFVEFFEIIYHIIFSVTTKITSTNQWNHYQPK